MTKLLLLACACAAMPFNSATACGVEGSRLASAAGEKVRFRSKKVYGRFRVDSKTVIDKWVVSDDDSVITTKYLGAITTKTGKEILTEHSDTDEIIMCASTYRPSVNSEGVFYISRRIIKSTGRYELRHWEDKYLTDPTPSEIERH